jgi:hypothetical protein
MGIAMIAICIEAIKHRIKVDIVLRCYNTTGIL